MDNNGVFNGSNNSSSFPGLPPNFDINCLTPAEREIFIRRLQQQQQQQQQQQLLRARQAQAFQNGQRVGAGGPYLAQLQQQSQQPLFYNQMVRPPPVLQVQQQGGINPQLFSNNNFNPMVPQSMHLIRPPPIQSQGQGTINPSMLAGGNVNVNQFASSSYSQPQPLQMQQQFQGQFPGQFQQIQQQQPTQIQIQNQQNSLNLPPLDDQILSSDGSFTEHLIRFLDAVQFPNRRVPQIANRPLPIHRLFQVVISFGGFVAVGESKKWPLVTQILHFPALSVEVVSGIRSSYFTFLYPYEQYFVQKRPFDKIDWPQQQPQPQQQQQPQQPPLQPQPQVQSQSQSSAQAPVQKPQTPQPTSQPVPPVPQQQQPLRLISNNEISLWRQFSEQMKIPLGAVSNSNELESLLNCLNSPNWSLKIESLLSLQGFLATSTSKELVSIGFTPILINFLLESLEVLWTEISSTLPRRNLQNNNDNCCTNWTIETFLRTDDESSRRNPLLQDFSVLKDLKERNILVSRSIFNLLRTLTVIKSDSCPILANCKFIFNILFPFSMKISSDFEIYKDSLLIFESLCPFIVISSTSCTMESLNSIDLFKCTLSQLKLELEQIRIEKLSAISARLSLSFPLEQLNLGFENLSVARQTVSHFIKQCAQIWKSVPPLLFTQLSTALYILTNRSIAESSNLFDEFDFTALAGELEQFLNLFVVSTVGLLRSVRGLYEFTNRLLKNSPPTNPNYNSIIEEVRKILETVIYAPNFSFTDGGYIEICLQLMSKCQDHQQNCLSTLNFTSILLLTRELRDFWRHSECLEVANLSKNCYISSSGIPGPSPNKRLNSNSKNSSNSNNTLLAIVTGSTGITSTFSHPFMVLSRCLNILSKNFGSLRSSYQLDLLELSLDWNIDTPNQWGRQVLASERLEESLQIIRDEIEN